MAHVRRLADHGPTTASPHRHMTEQFPSRVAANILPLSRAQALPAAFAEWACTGATEDHERPSERCQLCEQESLRYHFEIRNELTAGKLLVGSSCILRWQVGVVAGGSRLGAAMAKSMITDAVKRMQREACVRAIATVLAKEPHAILESALAAYRADKALTPKQINVLFWRLDDAGIEYHTSFFKVDLKLMRRIDDLRSMPDYQRRRVWKAMSSAQRKSALERGITEPANWKPNHV